MDTLGNVRGSFQPSDPPLNQFLPREAPMEMAVQPLRPVQAARSGFEICAGMAATRVHLCRQPP